MSMSLFGDLPPPNKAIHAPTSTETSCYEGLNAKQEKNVSSTQLLDLDAHKSNQVSNNDVGKRKSMNFPSPLGLPVPPVSTETTETGVKRPSNEELQSQRAKKLSLGISTLKGYVAERKGERADMQDAHVVMDDCTSQFPQFKDKVGRVAYYAVFDGHGGFRASQHCAEKLHRHFIENFPKCDVKNFPKEMKKMILQSFKLIDDEFLKEASLQKPVWKDGTTVCCVLIMDDTMYIINLGDSKSILCRYNAEQKKNTSIVLSKDHNPTDYDERQRIQKAGGQVREGRVMGILEVSRSIGDGQYKRCGVINIPDVKRCQLNSNDRFLLIACDGLWKVYSPDQAIDFILHVLQDNSVQVPEGCNKTLEEVRFEAACNRLASEAVRKGSADNVTVVLVSICKL